MKIKTVFVFLLFVAVSVQAQYQTTSNIADNGAPVLANYSNNTTNSIVVSGKFSSAGQTTNDFVTFDQSGNLVCTQNQNDRTFTQTVTPTKLVLPLTAVRVLNFETSQPATDTIFVGHDYNAGQDGTTSSTLSSFSFTNCIPTESDAVFPPALFHGPIENISQPSSGVIYLVLEGQVATIPAALSNTPNLQSSFATSVVTGPFNFTGLAYTPDYLTAITPQLPAVALVTVALAHVVNGQSLVSNQSNLEGDYFLGFVLDASGNATAFSFTNDTVYADQLTISNEQLATTNVGTWTTSAPPLAMVTGNFANDAQNSDLAIAAGNQIVLLEYVGATGKAAWQQAQILQASGTIGGLTTGPLASTGSDDLIAQVGNTAEIFSSKAFSLTTPPPPTTYTLTATVSGPGTVSEVPSQTNYASGTSVTLTATANAGASFSGWSGACTGTASTCVLTMTANLATTATFASTPTPAVVIAPPSATVAAGNSATYAVQPQNFTQTPALSASCPSLVASKGSCAIQSGQLVTTTTPTTTAEILPLGYQLPILWMVVLVMTALFIPSRKPKVKLAVATVVPIVLLTGCTGSSPPPATQKQILGTPEGAYTISVTATQGSQTASAEATLTVQ